MPPKHADPRSDTKVRQSGDIDRSDMHVGMGEGSSTATSASAASAAARTKRTSSAVSVPRAGSPSSTSVADPDPSASDDSPMLKARPAPTAIYQKRRRGSLPSLNLTGKLARDGAGAPVLLPLPVPAPSHSNPNRSNVIASSSTVSAGTPSSPPKKPFLPLSITEKPSVSITIHHPASPVPQLYPTTSSAVRNLSYIFLWYFFSTSLSLYNKNLMGRDQFNFNFPLMVSAIHTGLHWFITGCMMNLGGGRWTVKGTGGKGATAVSRRDYLTKVVPCGVAAALEICTANASLVYITLSFYTMVKSSTPIWVLLFAFAFGLERPRLQLISIIVVMVIGVILTVAGETAFNLTGFFLVLIAAIVSGLRWSLTQMLLQADSLGMDNPVATLYYLSPIMFVFMSVMSLLFEDPVAQFKNSEHFNGWFTAAETFGLMGIGGLLAFAMTIAEFYLIKSTSTITLSVAGISKEIVIISLSVLIYGDKLTPVNLLGLFVSIAGIIAYNYYKFSRGHGHGHGSGRGQYEKLPIHIKE